ncbi:Mov34/MPN/PAD-1 family protein [Pseudarthrobacter naphthalenicus]|uniref:Mov34/MPN/PAD-1 family protein n=1 Tax=Pseudarthrobacter naphthalenicus TaxID=3031328 RepID=UPI003AF1831C
MMCDTEAQVTVQWKAESRGAILREAASALPYETGGILLGHWHYGNVVITNMVGPGPKAQHHIAAFTPDRDWQYEQIDLLFAESQGTIQYLGDWHTHPRGVPFPSKTDVSLLASIASSPESRCPRPIMYILATKPKLKWTERLYLYETEPRDSEPRISPLQVCSDNPPGRTGPPPPSTGS